MHAVTFYVLAALSIFAALAVVVARSAKRMMIATTAFTACMAAVMATLAAPSVWTFWVVGISCLFIVPMFMSGDRGFGNGRRQRGVAVNFWAALAATLALYLALVMIVAIVRPPFTEAPMTGDAFESTVSFAAAMLGNHAVAAFMVAIASFMAVLFAASGVAKKGGVA